MDNEIRTRWFEEGEKKGNNGLLPAVSIAANMHFHHTLTHLWHPALSLPGEPFGSISVEIDRTTPKNHAAARDLRCLGAV